MFAKAIVLSETEFRSLEVDFGGDDERGVC
jgi:hypothetical protein